MVATVAAILKRLADRGLGPRDAMSEHRRLVARYDGLRSGSPSLLEAMLLATLLLAFAPVRPEFPDDTTYTSASGEWELLVVSENPFGDGPALYTMRRDDEVAWARKLSFTLREVSVSERGEVVGWARSVVYEPPILVTELGPSGGLRFIDTWPAPVGRILDLPPIWYSHALVADFDNERCFFAARHDEESGDTYWREYRLGGQDAAREELAFDSTKVESDAEAAAARERGEVRRGGDVRLLESFGDAPGSGSLPTHAQDLLPLAGTDLLLVVWRFGTLREEPWLMLIEGDGTLRWKGRVEVGARDRGVDVKASEGAGHFAVHVKGTEDWIRFRAYEEGKDWRVERLEPAVFVPSGDSTFENFGLGTRLDFESVEVEPMSSLQLRWPQEDEQAFRNAMILPGGRFASADVGSGGFHLWSAKGEYMGLTEGQDAIELKSFGTSRYLRNLYHVDVKADGGLVYVFGAEGGLECVEWDALGKLARARRVEVPIGTERLRIARSPRSGHLWVWSPVASKVRVLDEEFDTVAEFRKDSRGRWLVGLRSISFHSDGSTRFWLGYRLFHSDAEGEALPDLYLGEAHAWFQPAARLGDAVLCSGQFESVRFVEFDGAAVVTAYELRGIEEALGPVALMSAGPSGGYEVWQVKQRTGQVLRYRIPPVAK